MELVSTGWSDYEVIDSGDGLRLERVGPVVISRQLAQAIWPPTLPETEWAARMHTSHYRPDQGPGDWTPRRPHPERWEIRFGELRFQMRLTPYGHIGMFAEQQVQWPWIGDQLQDAPGATCLNLFGYTGGSTLAAATAGAQVTHVDAVKGIVAWARRNAQASGLGAAPVRWITEDALVFAQREVRRGRRYDAIVLDPPTFGRGPRGKVWKIERDLIGLLSECGALLSDDARFLLLTGHTPGVTASVLRNLLMPLVAERGGALQSGEMVQRASESRIVLPAGVYCRWTPESDAQRKPITESTRVSS